MLVSEIGEFGLIERLVREFGIHYPPAPGVAHSDLRVGLGDDAVVTARRDGSLILTTDTLVAGVHFLPDQSPWEATGWKALAVNLSDIAAMGGTPHLALITLCLPPDFEVEDAVALYRGLHQCAETFGVTLGGGDIVRAPVFSVTVALTGWAQLPQLGEARVLTRDTARPGDVVVVSGTLGDSAGGVKLLEASKIDTAAARRLRDAQQHPQPRVALGRRAVECGLRCGIDVSDGLVQDLGHVATASRVGIRIQASRVPISDALQEVFPSDALGLALGGGEDYELLLIGPKLAIDSLIGVSETPLTVIGEVFETDAPHVVVLDEAGREMPLPHGGWNHFGKS
ncbi:MAG TPA: thiamine-phosphate kinase [Dehalococcoidia bacterium]|nr:thiamine-phosphate kinase [Dehalococcoidia bacterium]